MTRSDGVLEPIAAGDLAAIDAACDAFETAWRAGKRPRVEAFCARPPESDPALLVELIALDVDYRRRAGDSPRPEEYHALIGGIPPDRLAELMVPPAALSRERPPGAERLGRFELIECVGRGGGGAVWRAYDPRLDREVALKVPHPAQLQSAVAAERFRREARAAARLRHPGIVAVHEVAEAAGQPVLVEDFVEGESLRALLAKGRPTPREAARLAHSAADAVAFAHDHGAVHRDLKPGNLMVTPPDAPPEPSRVVVVDFGLAVQFGGSSLTGEGQVLGTPAYMSPEQAGGGSHSVGPAADVYSLGAVLYELLTGAPPFTGTDVMVMEQVRSEEPRAPHRLDPAIPRDLETVCLKALSKRPADRYPTARELADDLGRYLAGEPVLARPVPMLGRAWRWARRRPDAAALLGVSALALMALAGAAVALAYNSQLEDAYRTIARARDAEAEQQRRLEQAYYAQRLALASREWGANNLSRVAQLLEECPPGLRGWEWRYLRHRGRPDGPTLRHTSADAAAWTVLSVAYAPDGRLVASASWDGTVRLWESAGGRQVREFGAPGDPPAFGAAFSPDGGSLAVADGSGAVRIWDPATGALRRTLRAHPACAYSVAFSPDGAFLAASGGAKPWAGDRPGRGAGHVRLWDAATGRKLATLEGGADPLVAVAFRPDGRELAAAEGTVTLTEFRDAAPPGAVRVWELPGGAPVRTLRGHSGPLAAVAYSPDGARLASAGGDRAAVVWDARAGNRLFALEGHRDQVRGVAFAPDGGSIATASADGALRLWQADGRPIRVLRGHTKAVTCLAYRPDGRQVATGSSDQSVQLWNPDHDQNGRTLAHPGPVSGLGFGDGGRRLWTACNPPPPGAPVVTAWNPADGAITRSVASRSDRLLALAAHPLGGGAAVGGRDGVVEWVASDGDPVAVSGVGASVTGLAFRPDGAALVAATSAAGPDGEPCGLLRVWEARFDAPPLERKSERPQTFRAAAYSPDGSLIAAARHWGGVALWDAATGRERRHFVGHDRTVTAVAFSPDGRFLATGSLDYTACVWDVNRLLTAERVEPVATMAGHMRAVLEVAFSPDGRRLATAGEDGAVKLWDAASGQEVLTLSGHSGAVTAVAFSPDGRTLASGGTDGAVRLWVAPDAGPP